MRAGTPTDAAESEPLMSTRLTVNQGATRSRTPSDAMSPNTSREPDSREGMTRHLIRPPTVCAPSPGRLMTSVQKLTTKP
jgi:hypothetical protein